MVEYEPDTALRDSEQVPLLEEGGFDGDYVKQLEEAARQLPPKSKGEDE